MTTDPHHAVAHIDGRRVPYTAVAAARTVDCPECGCENTVYVPPADAAHLSRDQTPVRYPTVVRDGGTEAR